MSLSSIYCKLNLRIEYPPPYACEVWDYGKGQFDMINEGINNMYQEYAHDPNAAIEKFDWNKLFA